MLVVVAVVCLALAVCSQMQQAERREQPSFFLLSPFFLSITDGESSDSLGKARQPSSPLLHNSCGGFPYCCGWNGYLH